MPQKKASTAPKNEEQNQPEANEEERRSEAIYHSGSVTTEGGRHKIHCLTIIGQIEGHYILPPQNKTTQYEHVIPQLVAIEEDQSIRGLLVILNTVGGDVEAGLAIAELLSGKLDGAFIETVVAEAYAKNYPELCVKFDVPYEQEGSVVGVSKGNGALLAAVNLAIAAAKEDGSMDKFVAEANTLAEGNTYEGLLDNQG